MKNENLLAVLYAFSAAVFYAINIPCSKILLETIPPVMLAGFLYIGAGIGVGTLLLLEKIRKRNNTSEKLSKKDMPFVIGMVLLDIIAPILLMLGVSLGKAGNASLLGNFEIVATTIIALLLFKEKVSWRLWLAILLITISSFILTLEPESEIEFSTGSLLVLGATICWGFENNCTRRISSKSTCDIVTIKGFGSGIGSLAVSFVTGEKLPSKSPLEACNIIFPALLLGFISYGLSIFTYIRAQKTLGAAKTSAYYAVAPFIGGLLSLILLKEELSGRYFIALTVMILGSAAVVIDTIIRQHSHIHVHTFTHTHDGTTHTHTVIHSHDHSHIISEKTHGHHHSIKELETDNGH